MIDKDPRKTSKEIQAELQGRGTSVSTGTICCFLSDSGLHGKPRRTPLLKEEHKKARLEFAKMHIDKPQCFWENVLWTDESKMLATEPEAMFDENQRQHLFTRTSYQLQSIVMCITFIMRTV